MTTKQQDNIFGTAASPELSRDRQLVHFVARHGIVAIDHVMSEMGVGRTAAYRRVATCVEAGLLERLELLRDAPSLLRATREGIRYAGLGLRVAEVSPGAVDHWLHCAATAHRVGEHFGHERVLTERELAFAERIEERPIASAVVGRLPNGAPRLHRPDLAVLAEQGTIAIEVELTAKSPQRLAAIIAAWCEAHWVSEVHYLCAPGPTRRAVERAVEKTGAQGTVRIAKAVSQ